MNYRLIWKHVKGIYRKQFTIVPIIATYDVVMGALLQHMTSIYYNLRQALQTHDNQTFTYYKFWVARKITTRNSM